MKLVTHILSYFLAAILSATFIYAFVDICIDVFTWGGFFAKWLGILICLLGLVIPFLLLALAKVINE